MHFSGPVPYMDHLKSAKHQKKVATQRHLEVLTTEGGISAAVPALDTHMSEASTASAAVLAQSALLPFVCQLCNVAMNCQDALNAHNSGKKHQKALQREEVLRQISLGDGMRGLSLTESSPSKTTMTTIVAPAGVPQQEEPIEAGEDLDLSCHYCGIVQFKSLQYKLEHLETDGHYNKKLQGIGRLSSPLQQQQPNVARIADMNNS